jgi:hypothetical protein
MVTSVCCHCNCLFEIFRNPRQTYCAKIGCQNARKQIWRRQKLQTDRNYQENKKASQAKWLQKNTTYWQRYREQHPGYATKNRQQQRVRQQVKRQLIVPLAQEQAIKNIINTSEYYQLIPVQPGNNVSLFATHSLAKSDALIVKISLISASC